MNSSNTIPFTLGFDYVSRRSDPDSVYFLEMNGRRSGDGGLCLIDPQARDCRTLVCDNPSWLEQITRRKDLQHAYIPEENRPEMLGEIGLLSGCDLGSVTEAAASSGIEKVILKPNSGDRGRGIQVFDRQELISRRKNIVKNLVWEQIKMSSLEEGLVLAGNALALWAFIYNDPEGFCLKASLFLAVEAVLGVCAKNELENRLARRKFLAQEFIDPASADNDEQNRAGALRHLIIGKYDLDQRSVNVENEFFCQRVDTNKSGVINLCRGAEPIAASDREKNLVRPVSEAIVRRLFKTLA